MLAPTEQKRLKEYKNNLIMPRWKYILINGVIGWGIIVSIITTIIDLIFDEKSFQQLWDEHLWTRFLIFSFIGIFMGLFLRWMAVKQLYKLEEKEKQANPETFPSNQV